MANVVSLKVSSRVEKHMIGMHDWHTYNVFYLTDPLETKVI